MHLEAFWEPDVVDVRTDRPVEGRGCSAAWP